MPQRVVLGETDGNRKRKELSASTRGQIWGQYDRGAAVRQISRDLNIPRSTVAYTITNRDKFIDGKTPPRPGRPPKLSDRNVRSIISQARRDPFISYKRLAQNTFHLASRTTLYRTLRKTAIINQPAKRRPYLTAAHARERLRWCLQYADKDREFWNTVIWSDECSVERGKGRPREWVFRKPKEQWDKDKISTYKTGKETRVMIWGAFNGTRRSMVARMAPDPASPREGVSANSYLAVLDNNLVDFYQPGLIFMQDGASIHTAHRVTHWMQDHGVTTLPWPPYSPDLNPIEHVWKKLKEMVYIRHPDLLSLPKDSEATKTAMFEAIQDAWEAIPEEFFNALVDSMPRRIQAVISAQGWQTKY